MVLMNGVLQGCPVETSTSPVAGTKFLAVGTTSPVIGQFKFNLGRPNMSSPFVRHPQSCARLCARTYEVYVPTFRNFQISKNQD
uniref:Uncharacterized protein n=1 Tax=Meloidogyne incognita TaxID=6306 RepID=A0A914NGL3_MELIC